MILSMSLLLEWFLNPPKTLLPSGFSLPEKTFTVSPHSLVSVCFPKLATCVFFIGMSLSAQIPTLHHFTIQSRLPNGRVYVPEKPSSEAVLQELKLLRGGRGGGGDGGEECN